MFHVSAQEMFYISPHELILSDRSPRRSISVEFLSAVIMLGGDPESKNVKIKLTQCINILKKDIWIVKIVLACVPLSSYLTS